MKNKAREILEDYEIDADYPKLKRSLLILFDVRSRLTPAQEKMYLLIAESGSYETDHKREWNVCKKLEVKGLVKQDTYDNQVFVLNDF